MTSEDLASISEDLSKEFEEYSTQEDGDAENGSSWWTNRDAENLHFALSREIHRRREEANPEQAAADRECLRKLGRIAMADLQSQLSDARGISGSAKIGDFITVRKPSRFAR